MLVFDVGANVGNYTFLFSKLISDSGKVYSFEPTYTTFEKLKFRVEKSGLTNISLIRKAVYSQNEKIEFNQFPEKYSTWNSIGKPRMLDPQNTNNYVPIVQTEIIEAITLDSFCHKHDIQKIDYLKIDVEGASLKSKSYLFYSI